MADTIKTVKSSGGDYSSLSAWEAGQQKSISAGDTEQAECYSFVDTTYVIIDGWTTVATGYIRVYTPTAERHNGTAGAGYRLNVATDFRNCIVCYEEFARFEGLSFSQGVSVGSPTCFYNFPGSATSDVRLEQSIVTNCTSTYWAIYNGSGVLKVGNCAILHSAGGGIQTVWDNAAPTTHIHNCSLGNVAGVGISRSSGTVNAKNCYVSSAGSEYSGTVTRTTCAHASATVFSGSTASIAFDTGNFVNVTSGSSDLHLASGASSTLKTGGTDLSADANYPFSTDIDGDTRSDWGIGADEYVAAGGATTRGMPFGARGTAFNGGRALRGLLRRVMNLGGPAHA